MGGEAGTLMARTWTLHSSLSVGSSPFPYRALVLGSNVYFVGGISGGYFKIYKWDGVTLTDISGTTFLTSIAAVTQHIYDICIFNGSLFCIYGPGANAASDYIYRYTSGTSWTNEHTLVDEGAAPLHAANAVPGNTEGRFYIMDADENHMAIACTKGSGLANWRLVTRNTSAAYTVNQMPGPVYTGHVPQLVGLSKGSQYGQLISNYQVSLTTYRVIERGGPSPWTVLSSSNIGDRRLIGYGDGKSFISVLDGSNWELKYSTDWGVNLTAAGNLEQGGSDRSKFIFKDCGAGVIMLSLETDQAYTWDPGTDTFVVDGTVDSGLAIYEYFVLSGVLYALTTSLTGSTLEVWTAGSISSAGFYYGRNGLQNRSALPFSFLNIGGLAVSHPFAILGSGIAGAQMVAYAGPANDYGSFINFTGALSTANPIVAFDSSPYGDSAGAEGSGEDSGPGGHLDGGKC